MEQVDELKTTLIGLQDGARPMWHPCPGFHLSRPAGYHSSHVSACSSNEKCLAVNEINTDIRLAQQELRGTKRARRKEKWAGSWDGGGDVKEGWKNRTFSAAKAHVIS